MRTCLLFRRAWPDFLAFDVLSIDGEDVRALPLVQRKRRLARIMPPVELRLMLLDAIPAGGERLFALARKRDLEGIVAKWSKGTPDGWPLHVLAENQESRLQPNEGASRIVHSEARSGARIDRRAYRQLWRSGSQARFVQRARLDQAVIVQVGV